MSETTPTSDARPAHMLGLRKAIALAALLALAGLVVTIDLRGPSGSIERERIVFWLLLAPLLLAGVGLARHWFWSRWLALACGLAVLPWAVVLTFDPGYALPVTRPAIALSAALALLVSLTGRVAFEGYEGGVEGRTWGGPRMALIRWTIVCNLASALSIYVFVGAYEYRVGWLLGLMASLLAGLLIGVWLLAHQRTIGLLLVALCCVCFVPAGAYFVLRETTYAAEAILFAVIFAPGVSSGWASLVAFSGPLRVLLRGD